MNYDIFTHRILKKKFVHILAPIPFPAVKILISD